MSKNINKPIAYDSGGGIVVCEMELADGSMALIEDGYECLTIFQAPKEGDLYFMPEDIIYDESADEFDEEHRVIYDKMVEALEAYNKEYR